MWICVHVYIFITHNFIFSQILLLQVPFLFDIFTQKSYAVIVGPDAEIILCYQLLILLLFGPWKSTIKINLLCKMFVMDGLFLIH